MKQADTIKAILESPDYKADRPGKIQPTPAQKAAATRARNTRLAQVKAALTDERYRFNLALSQGVKVILKTCFGDYQLIAVDPDHWYTTCRPNNSGDAWGHRSFCGCNDGAWADLLRQANVTRHPLFQGVA